MTSSEEFYIGWQNQSPHAIGSFVRKAVIVICAFALALGCILAIVQHSISIATFEWGTHKTFTGRLRVSPYPHLSLNQPGESAIQSDYLLVAPFKHGLSSQSIAALDGKIVTLKGTLIFRDSQTMIEALPETIKSTSSPNSQSPITNHQLRITSRFAAKSSTANVTLAS